MLCGRTAGVTLSAQGHRGGRSARRVDRPARRPQRDLRQPARARAGDGRTSVPGHRPEMSRWTSAWTSSISAPGTACPSRRSTPIRAGIGLEPAARPCPPARRRDACSRRRCGSCAASRTSAAVTPREPSRWSSHGDLIKAAFAWALGLPLAFYARFEIAPASVSRLLLEPRHVKVSSINRTLEP